MRGATDRCRPFQTNSPRQARPAKAQGSACTRRTHWPCKSALYTSARAHSRCSRWRSGSWSVHRPRISASTVAGHCTLQSTRTRQQRTTAIGAQKHARRCKAASVASGPAAVATALAAVGLAEVEAVATALVTMAEMTARPCAIQMSAVLACWLSDVAHGDCPMTGRLHRRPSPAGAYFAVGLVVFVLTATRAGTGTATTVDCT